MSFNACLPIILQSEGGYVDNPRDPGGPTNLGITLVTLSSWLGRTATVPEVQALTPATVGPIYQVRYYNPSAARSCPSGVDLVVFDEAVNQGVSRAIQSLQTCLNVTVDGIVGTGTLAALNAADPTALINAISANRLAHYQALPTFGVFGHGWTDRLNRTTAAAIAMIGT
jgi:lysozyme family protein